MSNLPTFAADSDALNQISARGSAAALLAVDTEFMREKTYRPELCLLQIGGADWLSCIDPLAVNLATDAAWLAELWTSPDCQIVLHAARQDLEVLAPVFGHPRNVFDTQIAAALTGMPAQIGYAELVRRLLGVELAKAHTRTDWTRRPLSAEQIDYALDDVRYLPGLRAALLSRLQELSRSDWLEEELQALDEPVLSEPPETAWRRLKGLHGLDPARRALAERLAAWRERRAIARNRPRGWILEDSVLRAMIQDPPRDLTALRAVPDLPAGVVDRVGEELLAEIAAAGLPKDLPPLPKRTRPEPEFEQAVRHLTELTKKAAAEQELAPEVLATRRDLESVVRKESGAAPLTGWRREIIGNRLLSALPD